MKITRVRARYYQQFDADYNLAVPAEGYAGWNHADVDLDLERTGVVVMHAWEAGTRAQYPGWYRAVEYIERGQAIVRDVLPPLLAGVRAHGVTLLHVVGGGTYYQDLPGYRKAVELAGPQTLPGWMPADPTLKALRAFKAEHVFVGRHNEPDVERGFQHVTFAPGTEPAGGEGIAENAPQLFALCKAAGVNHLIYSGFAINWCLLMSPGGMLDMHRQGIMCSAFRDATTAVENRESARGEQHKEEALWRVALSFGFVFDTADFLASLPAARPAEAKP